jgi:hypothetical protein
MKKGMIITGRMFENAKIAHHIEKAMDGLAAKGRSSDS